MLYCEHSMQRESVTDVHHADLTVYETWWKTYVWKHPGVLTQASQGDETREDRNGCEWRSALTHWP